MAKVQTGRRAAHWRRAALLACSALAPLLIAGPVRANPDGAQVVAGQVAVGAVGNTLTVNQASERAIVNWQSFSIGAGETTRIVQPSAVSAILNRVTGGDPSALMGQLQANGRVYLINPHGVVVGPGGRVDTGGFVASTLDTPDSAFLSGGPLTFQGLSGAGIRVLGAIQASDGDVVLVAASVENRGRIAAPNGQAILAAGGSLIYMPDSGGDIVIAAPMPGARVDNSGTVEAASAQLKAAGNAYALAVNTTGQISATAVRNAGGRVVIDGGDGDVAIGGTIAARQGDNGGEVRLLSRGTTRFDGLISVRGGDAGGDGGFVEVSGKMLDFLGRVDLAAPRGKGGHLLLDPLTFSVNAGNVAGIVAALAGGQVDLQADNSLTVDVAVASNSIFAVLRLNSPDIAVNADISLPNGALQFLNANPASGSIVLASAATINSHQVYIPGHFSTVDLQGVVVTSDLAIDTGFSPTSFTATNAGNQISGFSAVQVTTLSGDLSVTSSTAMAVNGEFITPGDFNLRTTSGNLTFGSGAVLTVAGTSRLAATGGTFVSNAGTGLIAGAGRTVIWASTSTGFNDGGLNYQAHPAVNFPNDPFGGNVVYFGGALAALTITADSFSRLYGQANPTFTAALSGGTAANLTSPVQFRVLGGGVNVGSYVIEPFGAASVTHTLTYVNGVLTVTRAPLTITANSFSRLYGAANPALTAGYSGLVNGDAASVISGLTLSTGAGPTHDVGSYAIVASGASAANYAISFVNGVLTVTPAPLTVAGASVSRLYGAANPILTGTVTGLVNGETTAVLAGLSYTTAATQGSGVGAYAIHPTVLGSRNYTITLVDGALNVTPAPLTVTAASFSRTYGAANPTLTGTVAGLVNGDTAAAIAGLSYATTAIQASGVGAYAIRGSGTAANYVLTFVDGVLSVTPARLVITANSASRLYGDPNPTFTASYSGLVNGDTAAVVSGLALTTPATPAFVTGAYAITPTGGVAANYAIVPVAGVLSVTPAPLTIRAGDAQIIRGASLPQLAVNFSGLRNGDSPNLFDISVGTSPAAPFQVGTHPTVASGGLKFGQVSNYTLTFVDGVLTVLEPQPALDVVNLTTIVLTNFDPTLQSDANTLLVTTLDETIGPPDFTQLKKDIENAKSAPVIICSDLCFMFGRGGPARAEFNMVTDDLAAQVSGDLKPPITGAELRLLLTRPDKGDTVMGLILPALYSHLDKILAKSTPLTPGEEAYVQQVLDYVNAQRKAAAGQAMADYQQWAWETHKERHAELESVRGAGPLNSYNEVYWTGIQSTEPPVPPAELLQAIKLGLTLNADQLLTYKDLTFQVGEVGKLSVNTTGEIGVKIGDAAALVREGAMISSFFSDSTKLVEVAPAFEKIFPFAAKTGERAATKFSKVTEAVRDAKAALKAAEAIGDALKVEKAAAEVLAAEKALAAVSKGIGALEMIPVVGEVIAVIGDWVQVGIAVNEYRRIGDFNVDFENAYNAAVKPLTVADLKAKIASGNETGNKEVFTYLTAMAATGGRPPDTVKPTMTVTQISQMSMSF